MSKSHLQREPRDINSVAMNSEDQNFFSLLVSFQCIALVKILLFCADISM